MAAKLTFNDIENAELDPSKLNFTVSITNTVSNGAVDPSSDAVIGSLYVNTASGDLFRKIIAGGTTASWQKINSVNSTVFQNRFRAISINSAVTSTDSTAPIIGDLVGYVGTGAWSTSGVMSVANTDKAGAGSNNAAIAAAGAGFSTITELFNGSVWSSSGATTISRSSLLGAGTQNSMILVGGQNGTAYTSTELFNGSIWALATNSLNIPRNSPSGCGTQFATLIAGGVSFVGVATISTSEIFNGTTWTLNTPTINTGRSSGGGAGSQNAAFITGGQTVSNSTINTTELFNGSSWSVSGSISVTKKTFATLGTQVAGMIAGGTTVGAVTNLTELFNGSTWVTDAVISIAKSGMAGAGSQNAGLIAAGSTAGASTNATELHSQTVFRKIYSRNIPEAKSIGILSTTNTVLIQGTNTSITYPANKYMILNRGMNSAITNFNNLGSLSFASVLGSAPTMTYNLSTTTNLLSVLPGMVVLVTSSGANPVSAANAGSFIISRVINPSSFEIQNNSGISQNPGTGTVSILTSMLAVSYISPQDIVVGKTDANGFLTLSKPLAIGSFVKRLA